MEKVLNIYALEGAMYHTLCIYPAINGVNFNDFFLLSGARLQSNAIQCENNAVQVVPFCAPFSSPCIGSARTSGAIELKPFVSINLDA